MKARRKFIFKLAAHLGKTVGELENTMSNKELREWESYVKIEPFFADRMEIMIARVSSMYHNERYKQKTTMIDYMLSLSKDQKAQIKYDEMGSKIKSFFKGLRNGG